MTMTRTPQPHGLEPPVDPYTAACAAAATDQRLDPITDVLGRAEIPHDVWQSGGFCMLITVPSRRFNVLWYVVDGPYNDAAAPDGTVYVSGPHICHRGEVEYDTCAACHAPDTAVHALVVLDDLPAYLCALLFPPSNLCAPRADDAASFDECEAAGVDGTGRFGPVM